MILSTDYIRRHLPGIQDPQLREDLVEHGILKSFPSGQIILTDKQYIDYIPLITKGGAKVVRFTEDDKSLFLYFLCSGETCTMTLSSCLKRETSKVRARTVAATEIILVPVERVYYYTRHFPSWNEFTLNSFRVKFDAILSAFEGLAFAPLEERVERYLKDIATISNSQLITTTHADLAEDLGVSRVGLSRVLKGLEQTGVLQLGRNKIQLNGG